jgi:acyl carrier protein
MENVQSTNPMEQKLRTVIAQMGKVPEDFSADADWFSDLGLDSFRVVELFLELEKQFGLALNEEHFMQVRSLNQFLELAERGV